MMVAQTQEKRWANQAQALEYYRRALASNAHNPPNAFARPPAKKEDGLLPDNGEVKGSQNL